MIDIKKLRSQTKSVKHEVMIKAANGISERKKSEITEITVIYNLSQQYLVINNLIAVGNTRVELSLLLKGTACTNKM